MTEHIILTQADLPEYKWGETKSDHNIWPVLITSGCTENLLGFNDSYNPWTPDTWVREFEILGLSIGWENVERTVPYPLDDKQMNWIHEDGDNFQDSSNAYWTYPTVSLYKGRRWLAPFVEYSTLYDAAANVELLPAERPQRAREQSDHARKHLRIITEALETLPFDTMIELFEEGATLTDPFGPISNDFFDEQLGYRLYLDLDAAIQHFGIFEDYRSWMQENLAVHLIEEEPV